MAIEESGVEVQQSQLNQVAPGFVGVIEERYNKIRDHTVAYMFLFLWTAYKWRKLRQTEDRVRGLQKKLRKMVEDKKPAVSASNSAQSVDKSSSVSDKTRRV